MPYPCPAPRTVPGIQIPRSLNVQQRPAGGLSLGIKMLIIVAAAIYIIWPFDFDFVPVLGWVDDLAVGYFAYKAINRK